MKPMTMRAALAGLLLLLASPSAPSQESPPTTAPAPAPEQDAAAAEAARFRADLEAPASNDERAARLVELFKKAGAPDSAVATVPLSAGLEKRFEEATARLKARLEKAGGTPSEIETAIGTWRRRVATPAANVIARLPGKTGRILIVAAHLDRAEGSDGILDDWAGCVLMTRLYAALAAAAPRHSIWFVAFARHEDGGLGAADFADRLDAGQLARIDAAITVDAMGISPPYAWWTGSDRGLVEIASDAARSARLRFQALEFAGATSDGLELARKNLPVLSLLGVEPARFRMLHGPEDRVDAVDPVRCAEMRNLLIALIDACDGHARPLRWDYVSDKLRIGDAPGQRKPLSPVPADLAAVAAPVPVPTAGSSPKDGSH
jgi:hypothetical protein